MIDYQKVPSPCYVIDEERLRRNLQVIKHVAEASGAEIILAFKGFAMWSVFPIVREYISGAAASSIHEARLCYEEMGVPAHTYAPAFRREEFGRILRYSSHISFNSLAQYRKYMPVLKREGKHISPGLRINPEFSEIGHGIYNPAHPGHDWGSLQMSWLTDCRKEWRASISMCCLSLTLTASGKCFRSWRRNSATCCRN